MEKGIIDEAKEYAVSEARTFGVPIPVHLELSERKGVDLARRLGADEEIVRMGTFFMDLKLGQALRDGRREEHIEMSSKAAREFLTQNRVDDSAVEKIINCVEEHHGGPFTCLEAEICANADCYRFIHPKGFFAYIILLGGREMGFNEALRFGEEKLEEKHKVLSLNMCREELEPYYQIFKGLINEAKRDGNI